MSSPAPQPPILHAAADPLTPPAVGSARRTRTPGRGWVRRQLAVGVVVALVASALVTASVVAATRRAGAAEPPPGGLVPSEPSIGWTKGDFSVSNDGAATYKLPLWVPQGHGRTTPKLALSYDSRAGNGLLGVGWSLSGLSSITWCARTFAQDGFSDAGHFDGSDPLCLDGNRLVPVTTTGAQREFRTERETFARITAFGMDTGVPQYFKVETKDGLIETFGNTDDSRLRAHKLLPKPDPNNLGQPDFANPSLVPAGVNTFVTVAWSVNRIEDRNGNAATVVYNHAETGAADLWWVQQLPASILYAPNREVRFHYGARRDWIEGFGGGVHTLTDVRMDRVQMFGGPPQTAPPGPPLLREYWLAYSNDDGVDGNDSVTGRSLLTRVTECDPDGDPGVCKVPLQMTYGLGSNGFQAMPEGPAAGETIGSFNTGDVNGDGRSDLMYRADGKTWVQRGTSVGTGFLAPVQSPDVGAISPRGLRPVDIDADGRTDMMADTTAVAADGSTGSRWQLFESDGSKFVKGPGSDVGVFSGSSPGDSHEPGYLGDLDGNGLPDFVAASDPSGGSQDWYYRLNSGAAGAGRFGPVQHVSQPSVDGKGARAQLVDTSGDGRAEVLQQRWLSSDVPGGYTTWGRGVTGGVESGVTNIANTKVIREGLDPLPADALFGDLNGDGLDDAVTIKRVPHGAQWRWELHAQLNSGNGFGPADQANPPTWDFDFPDQGWIQLVVVADFDGDGRDDVMVEPYERDKDGQMAVSLYKWRRGDLTDPDGNVVTDGGFAQAWSLQTNYPARPLDIDGDGVMDLVAGRPPVDGQTREQVYRHLGGRPDLLTSIGFKGAAPYAELTYTTLGDGDAHIRCTDSAYPLVCVTRGGSVVKQDRVATYAASGEEQMDTFDHSYEGARMDLQGRGWLGFAKHTVSRKLTGLIPNTTTTTFDNVTRDATTKTYPGALLPKDTITLVIVPPPDDNSVATWHESTTSNTWQIRRLTLPLRYTVELKTTVETAKERPANVADWQTLRTRTTDTTYDTFGNKDLVVTTTTDGRKTTVDPTVSNDTTNWLIGLTTRTVTTGCDVNNVCVARTTTQAFDGAGNPTVNVVQPGTPAVKLTTTVAYDTLGNVTSVTRTDNAGVSRSDSFEYNDPNGDKLYPTATVDALAHRTVIETDPGLGVRTKVTDPNGVVTTMRYDKFGRLRETNHADGSFEHTANVNFFGYQIATTSDAGGGQTQVVVDPLGRQITKQVKAFDGRNAITTTAYDALGRVAKTSRPYFSGETIQYTTYRYDNLDRLVSQTAPDGANIRHTYVGLETHTFDAKGTESYTVENKDGETESSFEDDPNSSAWLQTKFTYDGFGQTTKVTTADGTVQELTYDVRGRRIRLKDPSSGVTTTAYNAFGEVTSQNDGAGATTIYVVDPLGRVKTATSPDGVATNVWDSAANGIGKLASATSADGVTTTYTYEAPSRLKTTKWTIDGTAYQFDYGYDPQIGRPVSMTYPAVPGAPEAGRLGIGYHYNANGYLDQVTDPAGATPYWTVISRDAAGQLTHETFGNGANGSRTYNPKTGLVERITTTGPGSVGELDRQDYTYDPNRNVKTRIDFSGFTPNPRNQIYDYDELNRLKTLTLPGTNGSPITTTSYTYDQMGKLTNETAIKPTGEQTTTTYRYGENGAPPHALTSRNSDTYGYDGAGRQTSGPQRTITYNTADLPKVITWGIGQGGGERTEFAYDHTGARVRKRDAHHTLVTVAGLFERHVNVDLPDPNLRGALNTHNIMADGRIVAQVTKVQADPGGPVTGDPKVQYLHADAQGSTVLATTQAGTAGERFYYDPWGLRLSNTGVPLNANTHGTPRQGFTGDEHDDEFGLVNAKGRIYDPEARHFLSPDPLIADPLSSQSYNRYSYVQNNPATLTDPSGLDSATGDMGSDQGDLVFAGLPFLIVNPVTYLSVSVFGLVSRLLLPQRNWVANGAATYDDDSGLDDVPAKPATTVQSGLDDVPAKPTTPVQPGCATPPCGGGGKKMTKRVLTDPGITDRPADPNVDDKAPAGPGLGPVVATGIATGVTLGAVLGGGALTAKIFEEYPELATITRSLMEARSDAVRYTRYFHNNITPLSALDFGNMVDDLFKDQVRSLVASGGLPENLVVVPRGAAGPDVWIPIGDTEFALSWDVMTATLKSVVQHDKDHILEVVYGPTRGALDRQGFMVLDVIPLVYDEDHFP